MYFDDMVLTGDDPGEMKALQEYLATKFEMKDLRQLKYFLGIEVVDAQYCPGYCVYFHFLGLGPICGEFRVWASNLVLSFYFFILSGL